MHPRRLEKLVQNKVKVNHGVHVGVQQTPLGHAAHNLPQLGLLHAVLGQHEHHAGEDALLGLPGQLLLDIGRPDGGLLLGADAVDNGTGAPRDGRQGLAKRGI